MARLLRVKNDLQEVVISKAYAEQKFETSAEPTDQVKAVLLDELGFWKPLSQSLEIMSPIVALLRLMDSNAPCMGKIVPRMKAIQRMLEKNESNISWNEKAIEVHMARTNYLLSPMHYAGYALDPEFLEHDMNEETQLGLITVTERLCMRDCMREMQSTEASRAKAKLITVDSPEVQRRVSDTMQQLSAYQARDGIFSKEFVLNSAKTMAPSVWWSTFGMHASLMRSLACCVLAQPVCASACERNWSVYGQIKSANRTRLGHPVADKLVFCHEALHMREKLQKAGSKHDVVKWESDSDSDESGAEEDFQ